MRIKSDVILDGVAGNGSADKHLQPQIYYAIGVARAIYRRYGYGLTVTSGLEGKHSVVNSKHYDGLAVDIRTKKLVSVEIQRIVTDLKTILDKEGFDMRIEPNHIHIEYDPKTDDTKWIERVI